ncbi:MAG TPA: HAD-IA family hydrolase [Solirubrobacterales bacterium]|nr:HAD-IA family hydrolase [Solirubrobacterales bacterium]
MAQGETRRPPGLVIFDCDGVLVDSEPTSNRVLAAAISAAGVPIDAAGVAERFESMRLTDIRAAVELERGEPLPDGWIEEFERRRAVEFARGMDPIPGIGALLARIRAARVPACVASQASVAKMEQTLGLTGLISYFEPAELFSSRMVELGKPAPDLFFLAARTMGVNPARCVVIEDAAPGVYGALAAGMSALGYAPSVDGTRPTEARLAAAGAATFESMAELPALLGLV